MKAQPCERRVPQRRGWGPGGFSLVEVLIASAMVGLGVVALMGSMQAGTQINSAGRDMTVAVYLADEIREWTMKLAFEDPDGDEGSVVLADASDVGGPFDDVNDLYGQSLDPPVDARGQPMPDMAGWAQNVTVDWKDPTSLCSSASPGTTDVVSVRVTVTRNGRAVLTTEWLVMRRDSQ